MKFFITPPESPGRPLLREADFERALRERWPGAEIRRPTHPDDTHALDWQVGMSHGLLVGSFGKDGETVIVDGDVHDAAEVARWFRSIVPSTAPLVFFDEGYSESVALEDDTSLQDLVAPFLA